MSMFFGADRALAVRGPAIPLVAGESALVPLKLQGREGINSLFEYRLVLQTPDACHFRAGEGANFDLDAFVGRELTCAIELEGHGSFVPGVPGGLGAHQGAGEREISGLVTQARFIGESSRHALYELNRITLNAKERVTFNGGGSYRTWDARGITSGTTGARTVQAASHGRAGPKGIGVDAAGRLHTDSHSEQFEWLSPTGAPLAQRPYGVSSAQAAHHGLTPDTGRLPVVHSAAPEEIQVRRVWAEFEIPEATPSSTTAPTRS